MTSARNSPIAITSQFAEVEFAADDKPEIMADEVNRVIGLLTDDLQRIAGRPQALAPIVSGTARLCMPMSGQARLYAVSDTATSGSTGAAYHVLAATRNGTVPLTLTYDTRRVEIPAYLGGCYLGELKVSVGDIVTVRVTVTGAPAPTLTAANFSLLIYLKES